MDVQLQELVNKIKKDGVETAEARAREIVAEAEAKARDILASARAEAEAAARKAEDESARLAKAAESAIRQAGRNLLLSFRDGVLCELSAVIKAESAKAYDAAVLRELIPQAVRAWVERGGSDDLAVLVNPKDLSGLESSLRAALKDRIAAGLEIKADASIPGGFRVGMKDGSAYYDFSAESVAELFSAYLNPRVAALMKSAAKEL